MISQGKMSKAGLASFNQKLDYDDAFLEAKRTGQATIPAQIEDALKLDEQAWKNFNKLAPGYRKQYVGWLTSAKKPETRELRLQEAIRLLRENKKLGMK